MVLRFQESIFDNAKNTRGTFKTLLNISDGFFFKVSKRLKTVSYQYK